ncbi:tetratricopeptide repeat protein [Stutzerimonas nitrititolerans]
MRTLFILLAAVVSVGCSSRSALDRHLDEAYQHYRVGDCEQVMLTLSQAERRSRQRDNLQPEISLLRGQCLERQGLFVDAAQTYRFILMRYPASEYAYRGRARLETLRQLGHYRPDEEAVVTHATKR